MLHLYFLLQHTDFCGIRQIQDFRGISKGHVQSPGFPQKYRNNRKQCTLIGVEGQVGVHVDVKYTIIDFLYIF